MLNFIFSAGAFPSLQPPLKRSRFSDSNRIFYFRFPQGLAQYLDVTKQGLRILVATGPAAGISATFNVPIAGVRFSVEIILGNYTIIPLIMSSVMATIVGRWYFGDIPAFEILHYSFNHVIILFSIPCHVFYTTAG